MKKNKEKVLTFKNVHDIFLIVATEMWRRLKTKLVDIEFVM
ncbi:hypothetical protein KN10_2046 [Anoxybacillus flavithermus NBRC 109594]|uniref:Uncharacterized protein n=1 Tax=Anoxybacillus flavithermus NBRC 109594 TaxID=1315967 RepID=R4FFI2_9BACL|nr:hypothetical protein KN10_2046 [Anoxybacillus flavithermus NBRC 109594]